MISTSHSKGCKGVVSSIFQLHVKNACSFLALDQASVDRKADALYTTRFTNNGLLL
jgi:hypothetical protein